MGTYAEHREDLERLATDAAYAVPFAAKGWQPQSQASRELQAMANDLLAGTRNPYQGRYGLSDKYADKPRFSHSPYRTSARYASGKAGRRSVGGRI